MSLVLRGAVVAGFGHSQIIDWMEEVQDGKGTR
jgi:hypothetical protein